ncbi:MAG: hypothetical protein NTU66_00045 [Elusimicrobia bacterium]|nr:hypothetical protein [Elusimicrobiota bacterium]
MPDLRRLFIGLLTSLLLSSAVCADEAGLGVLIGSPTGITGKIWQGEHRAVDAAAGWSLGDSSSFYFHADYLFQQPREFVVSEGKLPYYYGVGLRLRNDNETRLGVRMPLGIEYLLQDAPLSIFIEMALVLDIVPRTALDVNAGVGVRYRFLLKRRRAV